MHHDTDRRVVFKFREMWLTEIGKIVHSVPRALESESNIRLAFNRIKSLVKATFHYPIQVADLVADQVCNQVCDLVGFSFNCTRSKCRCRNRPRQQLHRVSLLVMFAPRQKKSPPVIYCKLSAGRNHRLFVILSLAG